MPMRNTLSMLLVLSIALTACSADERESSAQAHEQGELCADDANLQSSKLFLETLGINTEFFENLPRDVQCFVENAAMCEHFAGEEPYDAERGKEIVKAVTKYCTAAQGKLKILETKHEDQSIKKYWRYAKADRMPFVHPLIPRMFLSDIAVRAESLQSRSRMDHVTSCRMM